MLRKILISGFVISTAYIGYSYYQHHKILSSESYKFAKLQIEQNSGFIESIFGDVKSMNLGLFDYSVSHSPGYSIAAFKVKIEGSEKNGTIVLSIDKETDQWEVKEFDVYHTN